uniref:FK506-binding protein 5-like isoform X2 n=1 Tax=Petromyzon marinus TaxID=7757 RepID=A0AAJ7U4J8_PETMA|nr:FK506-binding protein 5-like isoform X2 [Petromyzon marinus]
MAPADRQGKMMCPGKKRVPGSFPLERVLKSHDPAFVEFVSFCLRWVPDSRMTPAQALDHSWLRTVATSTTSNATTTATPGRVQCFGAAERRAEPALPPFSLLAWASEWRLKVVEEEETLVEELVLQEEETLVEELVVQEEETLVEELVVQEEETLVEELVLQEEEALVEELVLQEEETLVEELVLPEEQTLLEELVVQETLVEELVVQEEDTMVEEIVVEEMVVEEKEKTRKEDQVMVMQEKRKPGGLARMGRVIRSLLRRVLLCGGRSTAQ